MSTRANIVIRDQDDELIFYRHSDGYPEGTLPTLKTFLSLVKTGSIRNNVGQAAGWLILIGADEYGVSFTNGTIGPNKFGSCLGWKVGAYEPTTCIHGDIEYFYVVDLARGTVKHCATRRDADYNATVSRKFYSGIFNRSVNAATTIQADNTSKSAAGSSAIFPPSKR
jgi:hypothetical protein